MRPLNFQGLSIQYQVAWFDFFDIGRGKAGQEPPLEPDAH